MRTGDAVALFLESRRARGLSPDTMRWYGGILASFAKQYPNVPLKPEPLEAFIASCQAGDERKHGYFRALRCFYRFLHRRHGMYNPVELLDPPKRKPKQPIFLTPDQLDQLLSFPHPPKIKAALMFLADTGARVGELGKLKLKDIKETPWGIVAKVTGKTGSRYVPLSREAFLYLRRYMPLGYTTYRLRRKIAQAFADAKVQGTAHTLRHTFATLWEGDELVLQQIMGHAHIATTMRYRHLRTQRLSAQHNEYSPLRMILSSSRSML